MRGVDDWGTSERPRNFREMILWRNPNGQAPLTALMSKMRKQTVDDMEFNWWEEELKPVRLQKNGVISSLVTNNVSVDGGDARDLVVGDILLVEKAMTTSYGFEQVQVTSVISSVAVAISRAFAGTTKDTIGDDTYLVKIGNAFAEGSTSPPSANRNPTKISNYCQDFKTAYEMSDWAIKTNIRTGDPWKNDKKRKMFDHSVALEYAWMWGYPSETTDSEGNRIYMTGGLYYFLASQYDATEKPTIATISSVVNSTAEDTFLDAVYQVFDYNTDESGNERIMLCGNGFLNWLNRAARESNSTRINFDSTVKFYGMELQKWIVPQGTFYTKTHPLMNVHGRFTNGSFILNPSGIVYRHLPGMDTYQDEGPGGRGIQANDAAKKKGQWRTVAGIEPHHLRTMRYLQVE
jgi:hypothetical protein